MNIDRTVHAVYTDPTGDLVEVARYDRAGKWFLESDAGRVQVKIGDAVDAVIVHDGTFHLGRLGGQRFDSMVAQVRRHEQ